MYGSIRNILLIVYLTAFLSMQKNRVLGIDIFSGAGGMSIGARAAGIDVRVAVEIDKYAALTYANNHPDTIVLNDDVRNVQLSNVIKFKQKDIKVLFGGPPCQGFSTSNQKNRNKENENNWLFKEYVRQVKELRPDWVIVENVTGIINTENGYFFESIIKNLNKLGYTTNWSILNAADFGVPQVRNRVFIVGSLNGVEYRFPSPSVKKHLSVDEAISDLPNLSSGDNFEYLKYNGKPNNSFQRKMRKYSKFSYNNLVTANTKLVLKRYKYIPQGGNWQNIPPRLMKNYKDFSRCHTGIYHRLNAELPSVVLGNYRKNMLIHPHEDRGLSVREAARIQTFPDTFHFYGSIGFQQQQVGNSVPPLLAEKIFKSIIEHSC